MKLLIITDNNVWGGSELLWYHLQKRSDLDAVVWSPNGTQWLPDDVRKFNAQPVPSRWWQAKNEDTEADVLAAFGGRSVLYVMCYFSEHLVNYLMLYLPTMLARGLDVTILIQAVSDTQWIGDGARAQLAAVAEKVSWVFVSHANADIVRRQIPEIRRWEVVYNIPFRELSPMPFDPASPWAFVGRCHVESKGVDLLIESAVGFPVTIDIFGDGPNFAALRDYAERIGSNVRFLGYQDDVSSIWRTHSVLVMCSRIEGTPIALIEAGLCGRTVVATRVGGIPEVVTDGTGILTETNASAIRLGMEAMLQRSDREAMGARLRENCLALLRADPVTRLFEILSANGPR